MHMAAAARKWHVEDVLALPYDGRRFELIDGMLLVNGVEVADGHIDRIDPAMTPSASLAHQRATLNLARLLADYVEATRVGLVVVAPADVKLAKDTVVQPDVLVASMIDGRVPRTLDEIRHLLLAVEILSPSTARTDRVHKRAVYRRAGVGEYWIVDLDACAVERWRPGSEVGEIFTTAIEWAPDAVQPALRIDLPAFFSGALD